ncbi:hypothetical protein AB0K18_39840 [Nonomuraea sp. NPDC049421]|uniref:hypothetical protein n=1 Tax=Nonomuraea sp. NPDC049421 TaxID=3155275 RepID=UPI00342857B9
MEEFRMARAFSPATIVRLILPSILLIPVWLVMIAVIPDRHRLDLVLIAAGATVSLAAVRSVRWRQLSAATVARLSPEGVEMQDWYGSRVRLAWDDVEGVAVVDSRIPSPRTITRDGRVAVRTGARECVGLAGWGTYDIPPNAPAWLSAHRARLPIDPASGLRRITIPLGAIDPQWEFGSMGEAVRHHRPDLLQAKAGSLPA